jgi:hypothetical protein
MVSKEYFGTARTLLRIAGKMTDQTIANRLTALAGDYERRARKAEVAETTEASAPVKARGEPAGQSDLR